MERESERERESKYSNLPNSDQSFIPISRLITTVQREAVVIQDGNVRGDCVRGDALYVFHQGTHLIVVLCVGVWVGVCVRVCVWVCVRVGVWVCEYASICTYSINFISKTNLFRKTIYLFI